MIVKITSVKVFRTICFFLIMLIVKGCYSHFAINKSIAKEALKKGNISKIKLKDETEINFVNEEYVFVLVEYDSLVYKSSNGIIATTSLDDILQIYEYNFDGGKTIMASMALMLCLFVTVMFFFTVVIPFNPGG